MYMDANLGRSSFDFLKLVMLLEAMQEMQKKIHRSSKKYSFYCTLIRSFRVSKNRANKTRVRKLWNIESRDSLANG